MFPLIVPGQWSVSSPCPHCSGVTHTLITTSGWDAAQTPGEDTGEWWPGPECRDHGLRSPLLSGIMMMGHWATHFLASGRLCTPAQHCQQHSRAETIVLFNWVFYKKFCGLLSWYSFQSYLFQKHFCSLLVNIHKTSLTFDSELNNNVKFYVNIMFAKVLIWKL